MKMKPTFLLTVISASAVMALTVLLSPEPAQAGTAAYFGMCSFRDQGNNNGGNVSRMPCYAVEGANVHSAFFHIRWKDGVKTQLNAKPGHPFKDAVTGRTYQRVGNFTFVADADGDVIVMDDAKYTNSRYSVDDPELVRLLRRR